MDRGLVCTLSMQYTSTCTGFTILVPKNIIHMYVHVDIHAIPLSRFDNKVGLKGYGPNSYNHWSLCYIWKFNRVPNDYRSLD